MIEYRPFRNDDSPAVVQLWHDQPQQRGLVTSVTPAVLERFVFAKLYFDRQGLILATDAQRVVGLVHVGFGPNADHSWAGTQTGVVCLVMVQRRGDHDQIAAELLARGEQYLITQGAREIYGGGHMRLNPFYLGLYGGSELPGILLSDERQTHWLQAADYGERSRRDILQLTLAEFRAPVNRQQMSIRRQCRMETHFDPRPSNWWEASATAQHELTCFRLLSTSNGRTMATATFWDMEPIASSWGIHAAGLMHWQTDTEDAPEGLEQFLLSESFRQLQQQSVSLIETHIDQQDQPRQQLLDSLGFTKIDTGVVYYKEVT